MPEQKMCGERNTIIKFFANFDQFLQNVPTDI